MELLILTNNKSTSRKYSLKIGYLLFVLLILLVISFSGGIYISGKHHIVKVGNEHAVLSEYRLDAAHEELEIQKEQLRVAQENAKDRLDALASRLSQLQGHIMRLDALGSRIAKMADLGDIDFSIVDPPGMGGPVPTTVQNRIELQDFLREFEEIELKIKDREEKLSAIEFMILDRDLQEQTALDGWPVKSGWMSSVFGWRTDPINGKKEFHRGVDFAGKSGSGVASIAAGIVTWSAPISGFGNMVEINHGNGYVTRYAHNKKNLVSVGDKVEKGQVIAIIGSTGRSTGTHVHFEVLQNGKHINPKKFVSVN